MRLEWLLPALLLSLLTQAVQAQVVISELMAGGGALVDEDGSTPDWIELWNAGTTSVNLAGWHLTDDPSRTAKWTFPSTNLASGQFLVVFASGKNRCVAGARLHTTFKLSRSGEYLALVEADGQTIAQQYSPGCPEQVAGVSYGLDLPQSVGQTFTFNERYFATPTPGAPNSAAYLGVVANPQFGVPGNFFDAPFTVEIRTTTAAADIRFTTNGTAPTAVTGMLYIGPVPITRNTVLRAIAFKPGYMTSAVSTHTYISPNNVVTQNQQAATNAGFPATWGISGTGRYAMDPKVTGPSGPQLAASLRSLPSVCISTSISNLFDRSRGIYANAENHGASWERPVSIEWVDTNGQPAFQADCGLRIQGGVGRSVAKHSFRVLFKRQYGMGSLKYDLFHEPDAVKSFDGLVLRAGFNDSWFWLSGSSGKATYIRDEFGRRLLLAMGHPSARGLFAHLYINGLYWGLYNVTERPNEDFSAAYLGGQAIDWDSNCSNETKNGDSQAWNSLLSAVRQTATPANYQKLQGNNPDGTRNPAYPVLFDKTDYIDYVILNYWGGNWDWPEKNFWYGHKRTSDSTGFKFYPWDIEGIVDDAESSLNMVVPRMGDTSGVGPPHHYLKTFSEYKLDFADRVQKFFFNDGLLTPKVLTNRFRQLSDQADGAILGESARWGNGNLSVQSQSAWRKERDYILGTYLQRRTAIVLNQFTKAGLYPGVAAPVFSQFGAAVPSRYSLVITHTNSTGTVFFTLDGSDPRTYGSNTSAPAAQAYANPIILTAPTTIRARVLQGTQWSALVEATFYPSQDLTLLVLTEIMYHPPDEGTTDGAEFEFLELQNAGTNTLDLSGLCFSSGIAFAFTNGTVLSPGQFFVLARNATAFAAKYPGVSVQGIYTGKLDNNGDELTLSGPLGGKVFAVKYDQRAPWPAAADGSGLSLQRIQLLADANEPGNWVAAPPTPGEANPTTDTDRDGLPDAWEITHATDPFVPDSQADPDHDGFINLQEFLAGTDPSNPASAFKITCVGVEASTVMLEFQAISNHTYSLLWSPTATTFAWNKLLDFPAQPTSRLVTFTNSVREEPARFFKLVTPAQR